MSAKVNQNNAELARKSAEAIADADRASREAIAASQIASNEAIAQAKVTAESNIAEANRINQANIAEANRKSNERIAMLQVAGQVIPKIVPIALGAKVVDDMNNNDKSKGGKGSSLNTGVSVGSTESAKQRADELFPELEPTFELKPLNSGYNSKPLKFGVNTAMLGLAVSMLSSLPLLGL